MQKLKEFLKQHFEEDDEIKMLYDYDRSRIEINGKAYQIEQLSFSEIGGAVKEALRELYGDYRTIPYTFNSEAYENEKFKAEVLALGSAGLLKFKVSRKNG